jgi:hypothetical protein
MAEAKRKEEKLKMCKYSPDLSMECSRFLRMLNNSIRPFSQYKRGAVAAMAARRKKNEG